MLRNIIAIAFFLMTSHVMYSQSDASVEKLLCKTWKPAFFDEKGQKKPASSDQSGNRMIFRKDYTAKIIDKCSAHDGFWQYDAAKKTVTIKNGGETDSSIAVVIALTEKDFIIEYKAPGETFKKVYLVPVQ